MKRCLKRCSKTCSLVSCVLWLAVAVMASWAGMSPARADIYVIESTAPGVKVGPLADSAEISIPPGGHIRAVMPSGKTQLIKGPYSGPVADLVKGQKPNPGVLAWIKSILQTGGATEATPGATRSIGKESARPRAGFSWVSVPVHADSTVCVQKGARLQLVRAPSQRVERVTVVDVTGAERGDAQWAAGSDAAAWPDAVALRADGSYFLLVPDRPRRQVTLRMLERLPAEEDVLTELEARGCRLQFEAWVKEKMAVAGR